MRRTVISTVFLMFMSVVVHAQEVPSPKSLERRMNTKVIDVLMRLEECMEISSRQDARELIKLFESENSPVVCDLFSATDFLKQIPVSEYAGYYIDGDGEPEFNALTYEFRDIRKLGWSYEQGIWRCKVSVRKSLSYFDRNMIYYPFLEQAPGGVDFEMEVVLIFDPSCSDCRISEILCNNVYDFKELSDRYYVIQKNEDSVDAKRDEEIFFGKSPVKYNEFGQAYALNKEFFYKDEDVIVTDNVINSTERYSHIQLKYTPRRFRLRLRNEYAPVSSYKVTAQEGVTSHSFACNLGFDVGYAIPVSETFKLGVYAGLGVTYSRISVNMSSVSYLYSISDDIGDYTRDYRIDDVSQDMKFVDLTVPVYISPEFRVHRQVSILLDLGAKVHFNTSAILSPLHIEGNVFGMYTDGTSVPQGHSGIGGISGDYNEFVSIDGVRRNPVDVSLIGNIGLNITLYPKFLYLQVVAGYEYGLTQSYDSRGRTFFDPAKRIYPLTWDGSYDKEIVFRPLADCVSFWRRSLWFSLGMMVKF